MRCNLTTDSIVLTPTQSAHTESADSGLYERIERLYAGFRDHQLISYHTFSADWQQWERHPHGDEVAVLLSGSITFMLATTKGEQCVELSNHLDYVVIPRDTWHTARVTDTASLLFVTPGEGTEHKACKG